MPKLRVHDLSMSIDGYVAGPDQSLDNPLGVRGEELHSWAFDDVDPLDRRIREAWKVGVGATIMGRNMFGPIRGDWGNEDWKGWWGDEPPYHHPVFVLTHHAQPAIPMAGGTTFHFVDGGIEAALAHAFAAAEGKDVRSAAARPRSGSICGPAWWTSCTSSSSRCCSAVASASSRTSTARWTATRLPTW